jgi:hypothetical protein
MKLTESFYVDGRAVGMIIRDSLSGAIAFVPKEGIEALPKRAWRSVDELKAAVIKTYRNENPPG